MSKAHYKDDRDNVTQSKATSSQDNQSNTNERVPRSKTPNPPPPVSSSTTAAAPAKSQKGDHPAEASSGGLHHLWRKASHHKSGENRAKVRMVGHHLHDQLHHAFRSWFRDTESDGSPILPAPLSKKYEVLPTVLGQGSFAVVKEVKQKSTGTRRALKIIAKKPLKDNSEEMLKEEIKILGAVEHPNVIKMWDLYETKEGVFIVTDLCSGGELFDRLVEKVHYNELDARHIMKQVLDGVKYLHDHDIIHRDLKPENILLRDKDEPSHIAISDFGLSRFIPEEGLLMTACGSPQYVSPEVLLGKGYGPAVDLWSSGVIAYCLLAGYTPFYGEDQPTLFQEIVKMNVEFEEQYWGDISDTAKDFIKKCLCPAEDRMTAAQALEHPWLTDLPPPHAEEHRGACLKDKAQKHWSARQKLSGAITTVETVNYLKSLHELRQNHSKDFSEESKREMSRLLSAATHLHLSSTQSSLDKDSRELQSQAGASDDPDVAVEPELRSSHAEAEQKSSDDKGATEEKTKRNRKEDSAMSIDLVIMPSFGQRPEDSHRPSGVPDRGKPGTAAMAAMIGADDDAPLEGGVVPNRETRSASNASTVRPESPGASSVSSDSTAKPSSTSPSRIRSTLTSILDQYRGENIPETARTDPSAIVKDREPMTISKVWQYVPFLAHQVGAIGHAVASHAIWGPPKKSWGIEMTIFTRMLRETSSYTQFATVDGMQKFFELASFLPVPKDGLITPVTFKVKRRGLKGFLKDVDAAEDGTRELTGEWVVGKQTWRRLQAEWRGGKPKGTERVFLYIHGGAYFVMSAVTHRPVTISLSKYTECRVFAINYRLAPGCKFPGPLHDVVASWFRLTDDLGIPANNIVLGADSAGGGLACALMYYLRDNGYPMPSGAILFSPWVDLTMSCDSWDTNAKYDYLSVPHSSDHMNPVRAYLGDDLDKYITHPYASPLFGDMKGLPPLLIQCGDAEVLRDEVTLLAHKASLSGVAVRHELYEDCVHVFQAFLFLDASRKALQSCRHFVRTALNRRGKHRSQVTDKSREQMDKEMSAGMGNSRGEKVEPRTGARRGSLQDERSESDTEIEQGGVGSRAQDDDEEDEDWNFNGDISSSSSTPNDGSSTPAARAISAPSRALGAALGVSDEAVTAAENADIASTSHSRGQASSSNRVPSSAPAAPPSGTSSKPFSSLFPMTLEEAQQRASAGMRAQESPLAPALGKFHDPTNLARPKMRRGNTGSASSRGHSRVNSLAMEKSQSGDGLIPVSSSSHASTGAPGSSSVSGGGHPTGSRGIDEADAKMAQLMAEYERSLSTSASASASSSPMGKRSKYDDLDAKASDRSNLGNRESATSAGPGSAGGLGGSSGGSSEREGLHTRVFTPGK